MAINFPNNPSNSDTFDAAGVTFVYNSTKGTWTPQNPSENSSSVTVYATVDDLPNDASAGDQAFVTATNRLYISNGSGWYNIALINTTPSISGVSSSYALAIDGTPTTVTITATDPEGLPITYSIASDTSGNTATVTSNNNIFTITPSTNDADAGTFSLTFRASDGVNIATAPATFTLQFSVENSNYTTALITSVGDNNAVNNSFVDSSTNSHTITTTGNAAQTTFSPYRHGGYSAFFGTGVEYLSVAPDASFTFGTGDFTIEGWAYILASGDRGFFQQATTLFPTSSVNSLAVQTTASGTKWAIYAGNTQHIAATATYSLNQWYHWALVRESSVTKLYIDGVEVISISDTTNYTGTYFGIGQLYGTGVGNNFNGYLSDVRAIKGTALYTSAFTPPTERLTAITNTSLLTCHLPYFVDGSTNGHTITNTGVTIQPFAPYDYETYSATNNGGSVYFDGSGDYITAPAASIARGTDDYTIETWVYYTSLPATAQVWDTRTAAQPIDDFLTVQTDGSLRWRNNGIHTTPAGTVPLNTWTHLAQCRSSGTVKTYVNGIEKASHTNTADLSHGANIAIGGSPVDNSQWSNANFADFRVVLGTAVYTSNFTPPTAPLTAITNTSLLVQGTNAGIIDKSQSVKTLTLSGDTKSSTTQTKYLTSSMYFDGNDYILMPDIELGSSDYTVECWAWISAQGGTAGIFSKGSPGGLSNITWSLEFSSSNNYVALYIYAANSGAYVITGSTNIIISSWNHIAVTRSGNETKLFVNGTQDGSTYTGNYTVADGGDFYLGGGFYAPTSRTITGYMSDFRVTKGLARYTANFTPPTAALQG